MEVLTIEKLDESEAGSSVECGASIAFSASVGSLFGGVGAAVGGLLAATGPNCLGLWSN